MEVCNEGVVEKIEAVMLQEYDVYNKPGVFTHVSIHYNI